MPNYAMQTYMFTEIFNTELSLYICKQVIIITELYKQLKNYLFSFDLKMLLTLDCGRTVPYLLCNRLATFRLNFPLILKLLLDFCCYLSEVWISLK
jgi:hypothetical protein